MARLLRKKAKVLVAFGSCAHEGCIPGLANANDRRQIFDTVYHQAPSNDNAPGIEPQTKTPMPEGTLHLPVFYDTLRTLDQTVEVDYYLPGCPPEAERIWEAIQAIVEGQLPPPGSVIGTQTTVCQECTRIRDREEDQEVLPHVADHPRRGDLPAGAGPVLLRNRHPRRLRRPVPAGQFALHRLLRAQRRRPRLGCADDGRPGLGDRLQ